LYTGNSTTASGSITVSGANTCLFIGLKTFGNPTVSSPQVDGFSLTPIVTDPTFDIYTYLYVAPSAGSRTVQMTMSAANDWGLIIACLNGVDQSTPTGTAQEGHSTEATSVTSPSITGVTDGLILDFASMVNDAMTAGGSQTRYPTSGAQGDSYFGGFNSIGMSAKSAVGATTMSWTASATFGDNSVIAVPFRPAAGGGGASLSNQNILLLGIG